ncbi:unnamed protein product [Spirodela intermedia]|uniref:AT3G52170-like helix-turn-helix domain-containing protein n=1 Tax=Spirodela intermedia TaxID=51605 RepID=A0A7I8JUL1_SPIIN|nr:unnamed protein product [Spirodela intermedia]CAA6673779.1 unnamed protein product [Spirodela intermedia]
MGEEERTGGGVGYRASNGGKFPTASSIRQQTGGSYYVVKAIIQELEYKAKHRPMKGMETFPFKKTEENICTSSDARKEAPLVEKSEGSVPVSLESCTHQGQSLFHFTHDSPVMSAQMEESRDESLSVDVSKRNEFHIELTYDVNHLNTEAIKSVHPMTDSVEKDIPKVVENNHGFCITEDMLKTFPGESDVKRGDVGVLIGTKGKDAQQSSNDNGLTSKHPHLNLMEDVNRKPEHEESLPENPSLWGNLRSMARGIISFFRKM